MKSSKISNKFTYITLCQEAFKENKGIFLFLIKIAYTLNNFSYVVAYIIVVYKKK